VTLSFLLREAAPTGRRGRQQIHLGIDEQTLEVRAVEITGSHIGDAPILPDLFNQIPADEQIGSVTADGAYDSRKCLDAIADRGAQAVIPPRKTAKPWKTVTAGAVARNEALRAAKHLGRAIFFPSRGARITASMHSACGSIRARRQTPSAQTQT
jgi:transposase